MKIPQKPPPMHELFRQHSNKIPELMSAGPAPGGKYRHWETLKRVKPPDGLTSEQWWLGIKIARSSMMRQLPLLDLAGRNFTYSSPDSVLEMLHQIDRDASGQISFSDEVTNPSTRDRYIINSLIEEAITSSQLEGAATTRDIAKEMIRSGRRPVSEGERMILNNFRAMLQICVFH